MPDNQRRIAMERIATERISAIIRTDDACLAAEAIQASVDGGFRIVEFTLTTPDAYTLIAEFAAHDQLLVGAGTVLTPQQARDAITAGARFIVSPIADPSVIEQARALGAVAIPGAATPTEMETAHRAGADFIKVFPAPHGGTGFITAIRGPLPHLKLFPTAGVTPENVTEYLDAGCAGCGFVRSLFIPGDLRDRNFDAIRRRAGTIVARVALWKSKHEAAPQ